jgi:hypothetical protein
LVHNPPCSRKARVVAGLAAGLKGRAIYDGGVAISIVPGSGPHALPAGPARSRGSNDPWAQSRTAITKRTTSDDRKDQHQPGAGQCHP